MRSPFLSVLGLAVDHSFIRISEIPRITLDPGNFGKEKRGGEKMKKNLFMNRAIEMLVISLEPWVNLFCMVLL